ncbi:septum formation inhibitor Maf [Shewanella yunxiaonensis]|uniref:dTTP/UTP pyrophosphatase n=1 Tax=Shewanella yunxiaonensis TaxID=2829809 RepID=A0ABX7YSE6_9GAMM|nr:MULTISPECIES: Maf family protein [Shewanella]MDF0535241.1 Maf family protein [Shewanella sp. A32]QUN05572.1 septum formation inhibitor Maf [Shewanella yunxiaonensis]
MKKLLLASASPRRRELLAQLGLGVTNFSFDVLATDIDESRHQGEAAATFVMRLATEKAAAGLNRWQHPNTVALGSDTIVVVDDNILGKPADAEEAIAMLSQLSGREHQVMTAVAVTDGHCTESALVATTVTFSNMTAAQIAAYVASGEPMDKAGAYGIQGLGGSFISRINGSYSAVVGLPLVETRILLQKMQLL